MKKAGILLLAVMAMNMQAQDPIPEMNNSKDSLSYFLGLSLGYELMKTPFENNPTLILQGFTEAFKNQAPIPEEHARQVFQSLQKEMQQAAARAAQLETEAAMEEGKAWLAQNATREGVQITESGLQYRVIREGEGALPADTSEVKVHYEGRLTDGTVFDSSYDRGEPISFPLNRVIAGWTEGLQLMRVGSIYQLFIPSELGYGARGAGSIPPHSVLVFKVELLGIE